MAQSLRSIQCLRLEVLGTFQPRVVGGSALRATEFTNVNTQARMSYSLIGLVGFEVLFHWHLTSHVEGASSVVIPLLSGT